MTTKNNQYNLPNNWILTTIGKIGVVTSGGTPSTRQMEFWGGDISWITPADLSGYKDKYIEKGRRNITQIGLDNSSTNLLPKGSVLFSSRAPIGYTVIAKNDIATNQGFKNIIVTKSGYSDYLYYYLLSSKQLAESYASGTTFKELSAKKFKEIPIPLPPLKEQYRIVEKIEEIFSELDKSEEILLKSQKQLELYRQVVLKDATEGKLTKIWRDENGIKEEWKKLKLKQLVSDYKNNIVDGPFGSNLKSSDYQESGIPVLKIQNIDRFNFIEKNIDYVSELKFNKIKRHSFIAGDIVLTKLGEPLGKSCVIPAKFEKGIIVADLVRIRVNEKIVNKLFLNYSINSPYVIKQFNGITKGTTRQRVNLSLVRELFFFVPQIEEQKQIVKEIEYRFTLIDNLEKSIKENLQRIEVFRQTIYKKAFSGNLVSQNANDEPACKLLKRIKEEKQIYEKNQKEIAKKRVRKIKPMESNKSVKEILEQAKEPIDAKLVWQSSKHKNDIEKFYEELKSISKDIQEIRDGKISKLTLKK